MHQKESMLPKKETCEYFKELEQEDSEFFRKIKLDAEQNVESLFPW